MSPRSCERCGVLFVPERRTRRYCSRACAGVLRNELEDIWRFISRGQPDECWEWQGTLDDDGYGRISIRMQSCAAHRIAFELGHGISAAGLFVCHTCDNPPCCNPAHLFLGTPADNLADAAAKGRMPRGENNKRARLTADAVREIRALAARGLSQRAIAAQFGVTQPNVGYICRRETWRHIL